MCILSNNVRCYRTSLARVCALELHLSHVAGQLNGRAFWGRGLAKGDPDPDDGTCSWPDRSWASDFWYFLRNNHPIVGIICHDRSQLSSLERINMEFVVVAWSFLFTTILLKSERMSAGIAFAVLTITVTIPCMILAKLLFYIHACPCLVSQYKPTGCKKYLYKCLECLGGCMGIAFFLLALLFVGAGIGVAAGGKEPAGKVMSDFAYARAQGYVLQPLILFCLSFNPFHCALRLSNSCCLFSMIGMAQWQQERQQVRELLMAPLEIPDLEGTHTENARLGTTE